MMRTPLVVLDDVRAKRTLVYENPVEIIAAQHWQDIEPTLQAMQAARAAGRHLAGYFSYELGYGLEARLAARQRKRASVPLLWFGVFESAPRVLEGDEIDALLGSTRAYAGVARFEWNEADYRLRCDAVLDYIARGDIFQANLSFRAGFPVVGSARALYRDLRRKIDVPHAAYIDDGERDILSFSPELFFALRADGSILAQPMKGTAARGSDVEHDAHLRRALQDSIKNRAENLMIVDLMRNDLGRIAQIGSVDVARMFDVDTYSTLHQMTSTVTAHLRDDTSIDDVVRGLFPAGSITGAPKVRAMEIIADLEASPRGVYCGAIGHFCPDGSARFNVAIRTLTICDGRGELGCGGAVVSDSDVADEYAECLLKARYFTALRRPLRLIETLRCEAGILIRWELHRARLLRSAHRFGIDFDLAALQQALFDAVRGTNGTWRLRIVLDEAGQFDIAREPLAATPEFWRFAISPSPLDSMDELLRHKTDWREFHDGELARLRALHGCDEVLFRNERGELCEGSRSNLFLRIGREWWTPAASCGLLDGCLRREMLAQGVCREAVLTDTDLLRAEEIHFGNSLRGLIRAVPWSPTDASR